MRKLMLCAFLVWFALPVAVRADGPILPPDAGLPVIDWKDAGKYIDEEVVVQGPIVGTSKTKSIWFLNFDKARSFTAIIRKEQFSKFTTPPEQMYASRLVRIHGIISEYKGKPQIEVSTPDQITILTKEEPIPAPIKAKPHEFNGIVTVACYNTLNLFDEYDDPYHLDEGTPAKPRAELEALAKSIRGINADVIALEEVENRGYLQRFVRAMLPDMGYEHVVAMDSNDRRGIECAVLSRLPVGPVTTYQEMRFPDDKGNMMWFQRDLLRVQVEPPKGVAFDLFVVHLKSKRGTSDTEKIRSGEAHAARKILDGLLEKDPRALFMICGDFNDTWDSKPVKIIRGEGERELKSFFQELPKETATFNKKPHISMIDFILCSPAVAKRYVAKSYRVIPGSPETTGSDHNPVIAQFDVKSEK